MQPQNIRLTAPPYLTVGLQCFYRNLCYCLHRTYCIPPSPVLKRSSFFSSQNTNLSNSSFSSCLCALAKIFLFLYVWNLVLAIFSLNKSLYQIFLVFCSKYFLKFICYKIILYFLEYFFKAYHCSILQSLQ